ncbi:fungal-specific transcription factor domain protein [Penicillium angulare]|uniref:fungal-specific transcription factor domain protein n=1 Tax=Penicillium angulare TaxID=116970 RepID=UPI0025425B68|nr:fungal-specific transcription factor domain protein [Penicillium angulare]KAJ5280358.1 fungal-specific transcription factor domain protein [Penicillium angulare]
MPATNVDIEATDVSMEIFQGAPDASPRDTYQLPGLITPLASVNHDTLSPRQHAFIAHTKDDVSASPASSEYGSMRNHSHGASYVGSTHWASVLDSISELKNQYEKEEEARILATDDHIPTRGPGPLLLYQPVQATKDEILASIPPRPTVDRMIARYFNLQNVTPLPLLHSGHFLREYEEFWEEPTSAPLLWIGLLFSVIAFSTQQQQIIEDPKDPEALACIQVFRERTVHCLVLGEFTKGKEYVLETLLHCLTLEVLLCKDADIGVWLSSGIIVQLALSLGYHRDTANFPNITQFAGEMRRRVWAVIVQMDLRLSSQMGFPRILKLHHCDTAEPSNLLDSDFDETTIKLPPPRPETELSPVLYLLARNRIDHISGLVSDLIADTQEHSYTEIMMLDNKLQEAQASLPPIFRWQPLSQSLTVPSHIILYRALLQLAIPRMTIWLHRKYLTLSHNKDEYEYSRNACLQAAIQILEFQQLFDDETRPGGLLYSERWMLTSLNQFVFLLGMSILCYYLQLSKTRPDISMSAETRAKVYDLLRDTYPILLRSSTASREAQKAARHLSLLLGPREREEVGLSLSGEENLESWITDPGFTSSPGSGMPFDQLTWDAYQGEWTISVFHDLG